MLTSNSVASWHACCCSSVFSCCRVADCLSKYASSSYRQAPHQRQGLPPEHRSRTEEAVQKANKQSLLP